MDNLFHRVSQKVQEVAQHHADRERDSDPSQADQQGHFRQGLPNFIFEAVDKYVDGFAPHISPIITAEIDNFQTQTIESLEFHLKEAFKAVFKGDFSAFRSAGDLDQLFAAKQRNDTTISAAVQPPGAYGQRGLPFPPSSPGMGLQPSGAQEHSLSGGQILMSVLAAGLDKSGSGHSGDDAAQKERNIFQEALGKVSEFAQKESNKGDGEFQQFMGKMAREIDKVKTDPEEMVKKIVPEMKTKVSELLTKHHASLAEKMTTAALTQLKKWLRSNTSAKEIGEEAKGDITDAITGFFDKVSISRSHSPAPHGETRELPGQGSNSPAPPITSNERQTNTVHSQLHGIAGILSKKLSHGLTHVRASTRDEFRSILSAIERTLFNELPESIRGPLAKIFGGDPFDPNLASTAHRERGGGGDMLQELGDKFKAIVESVQKGLRDRVLEVVGGGHRRLESLAWVQVQETVVYKVRKYVPGVKVDVEEEDETVING